MIGQDVDSGFPSAVVPGVVSYSGLRTRVHIHTPIDYLGVIVAIISKENAWL